MTTPNLTNELSALLANSLNQYTSMRDQALARMQEIEKEKAELDAMVAKLNGLLGIQAPAVTEKAATAPKAKRAPVKRVPRKRAKSTAPAAPAADGTTTAEPVATSSKARLDWDAMTSTVLDVVRAKGPVDIKTIVETIGTQIKGVRYDTVAIVLKDVKDQLKVQGERPRLYSVA